MPDNPAHLSPGTDGPFFDDLSLGDRFDGAPRIRLTDGLAATHHAIVGGRLRLPFDSGLSARVTGMAAPFAAPALVWDIAIGQSTLVTQRAIANLFYRGLVFRRAPVVGDTLHTVTEIVGLRPASPRPGRPARGLVVMRMRTSDQDDRTVLDFHRCAMLPARAETAAEPKGLLDPQAGDLDLGAAVADWDLAHYRKRIPGPHFGDLSAGTSYAVTAGDVVSSAPELARLTMNLAAIHHDAAIGNGERLVYGGHTVGLALAQVTRALPSIVTVLGWHHCDHTGPVREGDTLHSTVTIERTEPRAKGGGLAHIRVLVTASNGAGITPVLDWGFGGLFA
jgi:acyl dehydratase